MEANEIADPQRAAVDRGVLEWLRCLADPACRAPCPERPLAPAQTEQLVTAALVHGVLPIVARRLKSSSELGYDAEARKQAVGQLAALAAQALILSHQADRVLDALAAAGLPGTLIKGRSFAQRLYPNPAMRPYSDVDILVPADVRPQSRPVMEDLGFTLFEQEERAGLEYHEDQWLLPDRSDVLIEIQDDLVHAPSLEGMSLTFDDLVEVGDGDPESATAILMIAAVHGTIGHQFEHLRFVVDVCQAARGAAGSIDVGKLESVSRRNGTRLAVAFALDLAARVFSEPTCRELADQLGDVPGRRLCRLLLSPGTVLNAQSANRYRASWRRKALREAMKRHGRTRAAQPASGGG